MKLRGSKDTQLVCGRGGQIGLQLWWLSVLRGRCLAVGVYFFLKSCAVREKEPLKIVVGQDDSRGTHRCYFLGS